ncbi:hypothetical protein OSCT_1494 [Oscillochloris trichoides DG-6]|uniref:Glycosyltransferase RgtA/B/C/D-like domain-containing protein n=1 Tax=Oscillochloris trichoides DG-6 TaxID=765420 RepID=E1IDU3_9CHLR|nr:hypothetical protein [Oscillochloris trichoides]EFO80664.1 hypothetical protein OSCT_1494 [Oscillochloris trichoides DG-6]
MITLNWQQQGINSITGDEPHYLLTSDSLLRDGDVLVVNNHQIDTPVLRAMPPGSRFGDDTHSLNGYSIHGLGLSVLLLPAYALGGVLGAKIGMLVLLGLLPFCVYAYAQTQLPGTPWPLLIALLVGLSPPFLLGSTQIYPDLLAGLIMFTLLWSALPLAPFLLALLPWLHLKFGMPAAILALWRLWRRDPWSLVLLFISVVGVAVFNTHAFGSPFGPYQAGDAAQDVRGVVMVALGLHLDRMQGLFMQVPLFLVGVVGLAAFVASNWRLALVAGAIYLALLLPSAAHTNWYGGASFAGRFFWALALLWVLPLVSMIRLLVERQRAWLGVVALLLLFAVQGIVLAKLLIPNSYTYTIPMRPAAAWMESNPYADFFDLRSWQRVRWLPSFRDLESFSYSSTNWIALALLVALALSGLALLRRQRGLLVGVWATLALLVLGLSSWLPLLLRPLTLTDLALQRGAAWLAVSTSNPIQPSGYVIDLAYQSSAPVVWECNFVHPDGQRTPLLVGQAPATGKLHILCPLPRSGRLDVGLVGRGMRVDGVWWRPK